MMHLKRMLVAISIISFFQAGECLDCFTCTNVTAVSDDCKATKMCKAGEICFAEHLQTANGMVLSYGCRPVGICSNIAPSPTAGSGRGSGSLVGRSSSSNSSTPVCSECCQDHNCNRQLCQNSYPRCADSPQANCAVIGTMMNICLDTQHAKTICRRFCGLCNYYDGSWSSWLSWSNCDVTCGNGHQTRDRTCTEPAPSGGGHDCAGPSRDTKTCTLQSCPVHGGWSTWASWGSCSVTCGVGTQRRDRTCSNPYPERFGDHCYGDSRDDKICIANACQDGRWSAWKTWTTCSTSCDQGIKTRSRACDSPLPSIHGRYCQGEPYEVGSCNVKPCQVKHGGWGAWAAWSACTATCNGGIKSRYRDCSNPMPSAGGDLCTGSPYEMTTCNLKQCSVTNGGWGQWSDWSRCTTSCKFGVKSRYRNCNNPEPSIGGNICTGTSFEITHCNYDHCQLRSGLWSVWTTWNTCGRRGWGDPNTHRHRNCEVGDVCVGEDSQSKNCFAWSSDYVKN